MNASASFAGIRSPLSGLVCQASPETSLSGNAAIFGPAPVISLKANSAALKLWQSIRAELIEQVAILRPRSSARLICERQLRTATRAVMALEMAL